MPKGRNIVSIAILYEDGTTEVRYPGETVTQHKGGVRVNQRKVKEYKRSAWLPKGRELTLAETVDCHGTNCPCKVCRDYREDNNIPLVETIKVGDAT